MALLSPLITGLGIWYSNAHVREQLQISSEGQITDRYTKAVENLGHDSTDVRLGGIYALERIMEDSLRDQPTVVNVLTAYIREHTVDPKPGENGTDVPMDVDAALAVLAHRDPLHDGTSRLDLSYAQLPGIQLTPRPGSEEGAVLANAKLEGAKLTFTNLTGADLSGADLSTAIVKFSNLSDTNLSSADLTSADLSDTRLNKADLHGADLLGAHLPEAALRGADLTGATLTNTDLTGADLTGATGLQAEQVASARIDESTKLPPGVAEDPAVQARISELAERAAMLAD